MMFQRRVNQCPEKGDKEREACPGLRGWKATCDLGKSSGDEVSGVEAATEGRRGPAGGRREGNVTSAPRRLIAKG